MQELHTGNNQMNSNSRKCKFLQKNIRIDESKFGRPRIIDRKIGITGYQTIRIL